MVMLTRLDRSVGGIRYVAGVFFTFGDGKANAMTQGKQLQCSTLRIPSPFSQTRIAFGVARHSERNSRDMFHNSFQIPEEIY